MTARPGLLLPARTDTVKAKIAELASDVIDEVNFYVEQELEEEATSFDPKVAFKSKIGVARLEKDVLKSAKKSARKNSDYLFDVK